MIFSCQDLFKSIIHNSYTLPFMHIHFPSCRYIIIHSNASQTPKDRENTNPRHTLAQLFAQAEGSRSSERVSRSSELPSPRRELDTQKEASAHSRLGESPLAWARRSLAQNWVGRLSDPSRGKGLGESLPISPRRDRIAWARLLDLAIVSLQQPYIPIQTNMLNDPSIHNITPTIESKKKIAEQPGKTKYTSKP